MFKKFALMMISSVVLFSCSQSDRNNTVDVKSKTVLQSDAVNTPCITSSEIINAQNKWGEGIVKIGGMVFQWRWLQKGS